MGGSRGAGAPRLSAREVARADWERAVFAEYEARQAGARRSLARATAVLRALALDPLQVPVLGIVGSKGKGSAAIGAATRLMAEGYRVGLITSPALFDNRERLRIDLAAIPTARAAHYAAELSTAAAACPVRDGYLSPNAGFLAIGLRWMCDEGVDALVVEAGMGGVSDELALLAPSMAVLTSVFAEHLGLIGDSVEAIATEKASVIAARPATLVVGTLPSALRDVVAQTVAARGGTLCEGAQLPAWGPADEFELPVPASAQLGARAAGRFAADHLPTPRAAARGVPRVRFPGRGSRHRDRWGREWMLDAAIDRVGAMASVAFADRCLGAARQTVVALPTTKDVAGVADVLRDRPAVRWCGLPVAGLDFPSLDPHGQPLAELDEVLSTLAGPRIHAIGTWSLFGALATRVGFSPVDDLCSGD